MTNYTRHFSNEITSTDLRLHLFSDFRFASFIVYSKSKRVKAGVKHNNMATTCNLLLLQFSFEAGLLLFSFPQGGYT